jgi:4-oxalocrotonate tautomerase family enzyme
MPLINVKLIEDVFTPEQKGQIVERLTDAMVSIGGENMRGVTWVIVEEATAATGASAASRSAPTPSRRSLQERLPNHGQGRRRWRMAPPGSCASGLPIPADRFPTRRNEPQSDASRSTRLTASHRLFDAGLGG